MKLCIKKLKYSRLSDMRTEVLYETASARAAGYAVIRFDLPDEEKSLANLKRVLRSMKKRGAVDFFIEREGFSEISTEARFLTNVCPECESAAKSEAEFVFVKI